MGGHPYNFDYIVNGSGPSGANRVVFETNDSKSVIDLYTDAIVDPNFNSGTGDWISTGGGSFTRVTGGSGPEGQTTFANLSNSGGALSISTSSIPCGPGKVIAMSFWTQTTGITSSSSTLRYAVTESSANGAVIGSTGG